MSLNSRQYSSISISCNHGVLYLTNCALYCRINSKALVQLYIVINFCRSFNGMIFLLVATLTDPCHQFNLCYNTRIKNINRMQTMERDKLVVELK